MLLARHSCSEYTSSDTKGLLFSIRDAGPLADPRCKTKLAAMLIDCTSSDGTKIPNSLPDGHRPKLL